MASGCKCATKAQPSSRHRVSVTGMLVLAMVALALALAGCQPAGAPSAQDIASKPGQSSMKDGHFKLDAALVNGATHYTGSGDGTMTLKPKPAMKMNVQVDTGTILGRIGVDIVVAAGKQYTRLGSSAWNASADTASNGLNSQKATYVGEAEIAGQKAWHIRSKDPSGTYDEFVRESDAYLVKYVVAEAVGTSFQLTFDEFNTGATVTPPSPQEIAASQYQALVAPLNSQVSGLNSSYAVDLQFRNLDGFKTTTTQLLKIEQQYVDGLDKVDWPGSMTGDVAALKAAESSYIGKLQQRSQLSSWAQVEADQAAFQQVLNARQTALNKVRTDLGLPASK